MPCRRPDRPAGLPAGATRRAARPVRGGHRGVGQAECLRSHAAGELKGLPDDEIRRPRSRDTDQLGQHAPGASCAANWALAGTRPQPRSANSSMLVSGAMRGPLASGGPEAPMPRRGPDVVPAEPPVRASGCTNADFTLHNVHYRQLGETSTADFCCCPCPVSRNMSNLSHHVGDHVGKWLMRQEAETPSLVGPGLIRLTGVVPVGHLP